MSRKRDFKDENEKHERGKRSVENGRIQGVYFPIFKRLGRITVKQNITSKIPFQNDKCNYYSIQERELFSKAFGKKEEDHFL